MSLMLKEQSIKYCDECQSPFFAELSSMMQLCPECAHHLYGYPSCTHIFIDQQCAKCGWDGSRSDYLKSLLKSSLTHKKK
jgi:predicted RNA-binding Zn-ribbon protein involved in translation (DUF1610 family)